MTFAAVRSALHQALKRIGNRNGHACPSGGSNVDPLLHELYVAAEGKSHFANRHDLAKQSLKSNGLLEDMPEGGQTKIMAEGHVYNLMVRVNRPSMKFSQSKMIDVLVEDGMDELKARALIDKAKEESRSSTYIEAVPK